MTALCVLFGVVYGAIFLENVKGKKANCLKNAVELG